MNSTVVSSNAKEVGCKIITTTIKQQQKFQCRAEEFYNIFTTVEVTLIFIVKIEVFYKMVFAILLFLCVIFVLL